MDISALRAEYRQAELRRTDLHPNPFEQFEAWFAQAQKAEILEPNAMTLATVNAAGRPSTRTVLMKAFDDRGISFFTNYRSNKACDIAENPLVSLLFTWLPLERQVRIVGRTEKVGEAETAEYFQKRPRVSQLGAWVSRQSSVVAARGVLEETLRQVTAEFEGRDVPVPPDWGGYRVQPDEFEFWQGRAGRLHDRFLYRLAESGAWEIARLAP